LVSNSKIELFFTTTPSSVLARLTKIRNIKNSIPKAMRVPKIAARRFLRKFIPIVISSWPQR
jgi:hypothetical protein